MNEIRVLTVDDEPLALRRLKLLLSGMRGVTHVGEAASPTEAVTRIAALKPDVVLLDIKMRDGDGFQVVDRLAGEATVPVVIFVTAYDQFALRAFERNVTDYLLKPVERERLERALGRARTVLRSTNAEHRIAELQATVRQLQAESADGEGAGFETEFWVKGSGGMVRVLVHAIECVSSEEDYVAIHTKSGAQLLRGSIRQFEQRVAPGQFVRVHRGWLVRKSAIAELRTPRSRPAELVLNTGRRVPVGRVYLRALRHQM